MKSPLPLRRLSLGALTLLCVASCGNVPASSGTASTRISRGVVIQGEELWGAGGRLLDALRGRVSTMQISRPAGSCPQVLLRGQRTFVGSTSPEVYVDRTRMTDTCILDQIRTTEVKRVEIYSGGLNGRAGYASSANGLIAVFLVDGTN